MIISNTKYLLSDARPGRGLAFLYHSDNWEHPDQNRRQRSRRQPVKERHDYRPWQCSRFRSIRDIPAPQPVITEETCSENS